jgi:N-acetylglutamate synthase-like GNAT family acetyltransferase
MIRRLEQTDLAEFYDLLKSAGLPTADVGVANWFELIGYYLEGRLVAAAGFEDFAESLLLRSVVVAEEARRKGIAGSLVNALHRRAVTDQRRIAWLLTTDSAVYFSKHHGYEKVSREQAPESIKNSSQFSSLCPANAVLMCRELKQ